MNRLKILGLAASLLFTGLHRNASAADSPTQDAIRAAVVKSVPLLEAGSRGSMLKRKQCFTCHNQGLPIMALAAARDRGLAIDADNLQKQLQFIADFLGKNRANFLSGKGPGGGALTAGYALWTLEIGGWKPDATTAAAAEYLLTFQKDLGHWKVQSIRPPSEESLFTVTSVALRGLKSFGAAEQKQRIAERVAVVREWITKTAAQDTEDRVFRLWSMKSADMAAPELRQAVDDLLRTQRADGSWSQLSDMTGDAYATATALVALHRAGGLATSDAAYQKGIQWLLTAQLADGSWHVRTRSKPIQTYFESGYPHGEDQFISIAAASWATTALALSLPANTH